MIGIYSSTTYSSLSINDCDPTYAAPNTNGWAYWVGTSFATPIISALLAHVLEVKGKLDYNVSLLVHLTTAFYAAAKPITWTNLDTKISSKGSADGRMIQVTQCKPAVQNNNVQEKNKGKKRNKVKV